MSGSGISWAICKSASHSRQISMPVPHYSKFFTGQMPILPPNQQRQSTEGTHDKQHERCRKRTMWSLEFGRADSGSGAPGEGVRGRAPAAQRFFCTSGTADSLFCYVINGKQLQKSPNLAASGVVVFTYYIHWRRGTTSIQLPRYCALCSNGLISAASRATAANFAAVAHAGADRQMDAQQIHRSQTMPAVPITSEIVMLQITR